MTNRVKELRDSLGLSQPEFARRLGVSVKSVTRWETSGYIAPVKARLVAKTFNCDLDWLVPDEKLSASSDSIGQRLKELRSVLHLTGSEFASKLGVTQGAISNWENSGKIPDRNLRLISDRCNVALEWLLTGKGEIFKEDSESELDERAVIVSVFREIVSGLSPRLRETLFQVVDESRESQAAAIREINSRAEVGNVRVSGNNSNNIGVVNGNVIQGEKRN